MIDSVVEVVFTDWVFIDCVLVFDRVRTSLDDDLNLIMSLSWMFLAFWDWSLCVGELPIVLRWFVFSWLPVCLLACFWLWLFVRNDDEDFSRFSSGRVDSLAMGYC